MLLTYISAHRLQSVVEERAGGSCVHLAIRYIGRHEAFSNPSYSPPPSVPFHYISRSTMEDLLQHSIVKTSLLVTSWLQHNEPELLAHILRETNNRLDTDVSMRRPEDHRTDPAILAPTPIRPFTITNPLPPHPNQQNLLPHPRNSPSRLQNSSPAAITAPQPPNNAQSAP
jgi:hypothetical protein